MNERDLQLSALLEPGADCPDAATWHRLAIGELEEDRERQLRRHAQSCPVCAAELRLAIAFEESPERNGELERIVSALREQRFHERGVVVQLARKRSAWALPGLLAAAAALLLAVGLFLALPPAPPAVSPPGDGELLRGGAVELVAPLGELEELPASFRWETLPGADRYRLTVSRVDGEIVWGLETGSSRVEVPAETRSLLRPAVAYRWRVEALDAEGRELGRSTTEQFRVAP